MFQPPYCRPLDDFPLAPQHERPRLDMMLPRFARRWWWLVASCRLQAHPGRRAVSSRPYAHRHPGYPSPLFPQLFFHWLSKLLPPVCRANDPGGARNRYITAAPSHHCCPPWIPRVLGPSHPMAGGRLQLLLEPYFCACTSPHDFHGSESYLLMRRSLSTAQSFPDRISFLQPIRFRTSCYLQLNSLPPFSPKKN